MNRIGIAFTGVPFSVKELTDYAKLAEENEFESIWFMEDYFLRDAISTLASFALVTDKIKIATGLINPYSRHPALIATTMATLDELSNGRAILGIGAGVPPLIRQMVEYKKPLAAVREGVTVIRELLAKPSVTFHGEVIDAENIRFGYCPYFAPYGTFEPKRKRIPIYVAGMGPRMLQLAGEIGDGVLISAGFSTELVKTSIENVEIGVRRSGKSLGEIDIAGYIVCAVSADGRISNETKGFVACCIAQFFDLPALKLSGFEEGDVKPVREAFERGGYQEASKYVTDDMVNAFTASGKPEKCREKLEEFKEAGLKLPIIVPLGSEDIRLAIEVLR